MNFPSPNYVKGCDIIIDILMSDPTKYVSYICIQLEKNVEAEFLT